ncbi:MAG: MarR family transcriptional regulator, partial [Armatimonadetes bacterium]|nr:MarR family transcriptional regulator [Armatimonadota bacterium]
NLISELSEHQVSVAQIQALRYVWLHENVLMGDLAAGLGISYPSATNMVKRLEKRKLALRRPNPADRREVEVCLTRQGTALAEGMERARVERLAGVLSAMDVGDRDSLLRGLRSFVKTAVTERGELAASVCLRCGAHASDGCPVAECLNAHANR